MKKSSSKNTTKGNVLRLQEAEKSLKKMLEDIKPFIRSRKTEKHSSAGQWIDSDGIELLCADKENPAILSIS